MANRNTLWKTLFASTVSLGLIFGVTQVPFPQGLSRTVAQAQTATGAMTLSELESILREESIAIDGSPGQWQMTINGRSLIVLADAPNNRMRIVAPVIPASELSAQQIQAVLLANFHTALDARYALSDDTVVSMFVHPLASLDEDYLRSAISQVSTLADNFGTTYSSGGIGFGGAGQSAAPVPSSGESLSI